MTIQINIPHNKLDITAQKTNVQNLNAINWPRYGKSTRKFQKTFHSATIS
jgi:hypothetical protein